MATEKDRAGNELVRHAHLPAEVTHLLTLKTKKLIRLPLTASRRNTITHAKLLTAVDKNAYDGWGFHGEFMRPGALVEASRIVKESGVPPILLECAGGLPGGRGHNRAQYLYILWRYDAKSEAWIELARSSSAAWEWALDLREPARRALDCGREAESCNSAAAAVRVVETLERAIAPLAALEKQQVFGIVYDQLASRISAA